MRWKSACFRFEPFFIIFWQTLKLFLSLKQSLGIFWPHFFQGYMHPHSSSDLWNFGLRGSGTSTVRTHYRQKFAPLLTCFAWSLTLRVKPPSIVFLQSLGGPLAITFHFTSFSVAVTVLPNTNPKNCPERSFGIGSFTYWLSASKLYDLRVGWIFLRTAWNVLFTSVYAMALSL